MRLNKDNPNSIHKITDKKRLKKRNFHTLNVNFYNRNKSIKRSQKIFKTNDRNINRFRGRYVTLPRKHGRRLRQNQFIPRLIGRKEQRQAPQLQANR